MNFHYSKVFLSVKVNSSKLKGIKRRDSSRRKKTLFFKFHFFLWIWIPNFSIFEWFWNSFKQLGRHFNLSISLLFEKANDNLIIQSMILQSKTIKNHSELHFLFVIIFCNFLSYDSLQDISIILFLIVDVYHFIFIFFAIKVHLSLSFFIYFYFYFLIIFSMFFPFYQLPRHILYKHNGHFKYSKERLSSN